MENTDSNANIQWIKKSVSYTHIKWHVSHKDFIYISFLRTSFSMNTICCWLQKKINNNDNDDAFGCCYGSFHFPYPKEILMEYCYQTLITVNAI